MCGCEAVACSRRAAAVQVSRTADGVGWSWVPGLFRVKRGLPWGYLLGHAASDLSAGIGTGCTDALAAHFPRASRRRTASTRRDRIAPSASLLGLHSTRQISRTSHITCTLHHGCFTKGYAPRRPQYVGTAVANSSVPYPARVFSSHVTC
jgi:hypothetical protein